MKNNYDDEFPLLAGIGLYVKDTRGDGNCLFNALSDQLYGHEDMHSELRSKTIFYMRQNADLFKPFVSVYSDGATRRNPKRKAAGGYSGREDVEALTPEQIDRNFEQHLERMSQGGAWGDHLELHAFANAYSVDVKVYQKGFAYLMKGQPSEGKPEQITCHIAYHDWEHYSSIRNVNGPHSGPPEINERALTHEEKEDQKARLAAAPSFPHWKIGKLIASMPFEINRKTAAMALEQTHGDIDEAWQKLYDGNGSLELPGMTDSNVIRESGSDEDARHVAPKKRQDRKLSRTSKSHLKRRQEKKRQEISRRLGNWDDDSLENLITISSSPLRGTHHAAPEEVDDTDEEDWSQGCDLPLPRLKDGSTSSESEYTDASFPSQSTESTAFSAMANPASGKTVRLKLTMAPKEDEPHKSPSPSKLIFKREGSLEPNGHNAARKPPQQSKRLVSARDKKTLSKMAQKQAAKERRKAESANNRKSSSSGPSITAVEASTQPAQPVIPANGIRTLFI